MSKREVGQLGSANEVEGPRIKRRREVGASSDAEMPHLDVRNVGILDAGGSSSEKRQEAQQLGLKLWQTVKDAVNKEGRALSLSFLRRPPKRQYPDYYQIIQQPIALDDIRRKLDNHGYDSFEAVRQDFELCFTNAKQYNMKESDIWKDAKDLLKLVNRTFSKLAPPDDHGENADGDGKGKSKGPSLNRLIKSRLQKLVSKTDDTGRVVSAEFMELPSKKEWPIYYKQIKRPQCLENIFKHIKRKEYHSSIEFAADVELVFENAMSFNQEHTGIWEDAKTLRDYFRLLMSDLPSPYSLPEHAALKPKIKIKPHPIQQGASAAPAAPSATQQSSSLTQTLRIPAAKQVKSSPAPTADTLGLPSAATPNNAMLAKQITQPTPVGAPQPTSINTTLSHYPNASYIPPVHATAAASTSTVPSGSRNTPILQPPSTSSSPAPLLNPSHQLKSVLLSVQPVGRTVSLDYQDGVRSWALRLLPGETEVVVSRVTLLGDEEEESSDEEDEEMDLKHEEEEEDIEIDAPKHGRKRGKAKGRLRTKGTGKIAVAAKAKVVAKKKSKIGPIQVKLNGTTVKEQEEGTTTWTVNIAIGSSVLEIGEGGGLVWKVYVQRMGD